MVEWDYSDLAAEHGRTDEAIELATESEVLPFFSTEEEPEMISGQGK